MPAILSGYQSGKKSSFTKKESDDTWVELMKTSYSN